MNDVDQARLYRRLALLVKVAAIGIIASSGAYEYFSGGPGIFPTWGAIDGFLSVDLNNGRRLEVSLGRKPESATQSTATSLVPGSDVPARGHAADAAPIPPARKRSPADPAAAAVSSAPVESGRRFALCSLGEDGAARGSVQRASLSAGSETVVDGYGLTDATLVGPAAETSSSVLPLLSSIKAQGAVAGLRVAAPNGVAGAMRPLPNSIDTISPGAGVFVMGVAHDAIDLLEVGHGSFTAELTPWYHTLNAGMRSEIVGGLACDASAPAGAMPGTVDVRQLMTERNLYVSDGHSRLFNFLVSGHGPDRRVGHEVRLKQPGLVEIKASLAAELASTDTRSAAKGSAWNIENARYGATRAVNVELVVNGDVVATKSIVADGTRQSIAFAVPIERSSWVALRLMGGGHSNPVYVLVDNKPVRASRNSIEWSQRALVQAFENERPTWSAADVPIAAAAFNYAYALYGGLLRETVSP